MFGENVIMADEKNQTIMYYSQRRSINDKVIAIGRTKIVAIITLVAIIMAVAVAYTLILLFADNNFPVLFVLNMAIFIPIVIAPVLAWPLVGSHFRLINIERELYFSATYDMLTGFLSRNAFFSNLKLVHDLAIRNKTPLTIASIDIDEFKKINDSYGHAAGDEVLRVFGDLVKSAVRKSDFVGRVGGDEFVLVLPYTEVAEASHVAENIRALVENTPVTYGNMQISFSLSIGISQVDSFTPEMIDEVLVYSDKALYQAKQSGRNCVVVSAFALVQ